MNAVDFTCTVLALVGIVCALVMAL